MTIADLRGQPLGTRTLRYDTADAALYALAVGASADDLDLVYERDLQVLPTYAAALGIWATTEAALAGRYDESKVLHLSQKVRLHTPLPRAAVFDSRARVVEVFDKGSAALVHVLVETEYFDATYLMFVPGEGGWGGDRGPSARRTEVTDAAWEHSFATAANAAALYRLTGDPHPVHIDPVVAHANGYRGPILHGLCTFGTIVRVVTRAFDIDPASVVDLEASFLAPVYPADVLEVSAQRAPDGSTLFVSRVGDTPVLSGAVATRLPAVDAPAVSASAGGR
ncbi:MaoC/PaaZ C-terminal domain-containing protein [Rhodococcus opacus]|uniref:MaoC/PaaZ C-terminal domain-containing protein n=1 Tax=Rhodococcus opacus TaxID=37919 RepID=UPI0024B9102E|nr:MaoC/PaaZ C-terminal domain-containing protein [Rhodococcus opacus]MDJ0419877.1 MaoC/PaaZ C-terminal domain-containing protein [Rhodococcus opacus]MDV6245264.1 MaoC/PaaZ C-terminal domain-containing protein [Rhodococcus opacus]